MKAVKVNHENEDNNYLEISVNDAIVGTEHAKFYNVDFIKIDRSHITMKVKGNIVGRILWPITNKLYLVEETGKAKIIKLIIIEYFPEWSNDVDLMYI